MAPRSRLLPLVALLLATPAAAETVTLTAVESGSGCSISSGGSSYYVTGTSVSLLIFDLSTLDARATSATLRLDNPANGFGSPQGTETFDVYGVTSEHAALACGPVWDPGVWAKLRDLGAGALLGSVEVTSAGPRTLEIPLDERTVRVIERAQGAFVLSGRLRDAELWGIEYLFRFAGPAQLVLETDPSGEISPPATLHVDPVVGSDLGDGSPAAPFATLAVALDLAAPGDTVAAGPGTYPEVLSLKNGVRLVGAGPDASVIDATGSPVAIRCADDAVLEGFRIANGSGGDNNTGHPVAISCRNGASPEIVNNRIENNVGRAIDLIDSNARIVGNEIRSSPLEASSADGVLIEGGAPLFEGNLVDEGITIRPDAIRFERNRLTLWVGVSSCASGAGATSRIANNVFQGGGLDVQSCQDHEVVVTNNTFFGGTRHRLSGASATIANNAFLGSDRAVSASSSASVELLHNNAFGTGVPGQRESYDGVADPTGTNGNVSVDPLFLDPLGGDFRLSVRSPLIDAGTNELAALDSEDFDGDARIQDGDGDGAAVADIGSQEFGVDESTPILAVIDIEPKRDPSWVRIPKRESEKTTAAILSRDDLDAPAEVDPDTLALGTEGSLVRKRGRPVCQAKDVDRERGKDLVCQFFTARVVAGTTLDGACLTGATFDGRPLKGCQRLRVFSSEYDP